MQSRCSSADRPSPQLESAWHCRNESKKAPYLQLDQTPSACNQHVIRMQSACNQHAISMPSACHQHAISMQPAPECNQHATREQSACSQGALGVREMGEEPFGSEEELGGGCRRVVGNAERRLRNGIIRMHSACTRTQHGTQHAFSMQSDQHTCETETQRPGLHRCTRGEYCRSGCSCIVLRLAGSTSPVDMRFIQPPSRISCAA